MRLEKNRKRIGLSALIALVLSVALSLFTLTACGETPVDVGTIEFPQANQTIFVGESVTLTPTLSVADAAITWTSSDTAVATVSRGRVTGKKVGKATITASLSDTVSATCEITVKEDDRTVTMSATTKEVDVKDGPVTFDLTATITDNSDLIWSADSDIATIANGKVTIAKVTKATTVTVTAKAKTGSAQGTCVISVVNSGVPADYYVIERNGSKASIPADAWYYFTKGAHASRFDFAVDPIGDGQNPYFANGTATIAFTRLTSPTEEEKEGQTGDAAADTQYEFRYLPGEKTGEGFVPGDSYELTFTIESTVAGTIHTVLSAEEGENSADVIDADGNFTIEANTPKTMKLNGKVTAGEPFALRPLIYEIPEGVQLKVTLKDISWKKTAASENPPEETTGYDLPKANNDAGAAALVGKWSYYLKKAAADAGCAIKTNRFEDTGIVVAWTNFQPNGNNDCERIYFMPEQAAGTTVTVTFKIMMNVDGKIVAGLAGSGETALTANTPVELTFTFEVGTSALRLAPVPTAEGAVDELTVTITDFTCTAAQ